MQLSDTDRLAREHLSQFGADRFGFVVTNGEAAFVKWVLERSAFKCASQDVI